MRRALLVMCVLAVSATVAFGALTAWIYLFDESRAEKRVQLLELTEATVALGLAQKAELDRVVLVLAGHRLAGEGGLLVAALAIGLLGAVVARRWVLPVAGLLVVSAVVIVVLCPGDTLGVGASPRSRAMIGGLLALMAAGSAIAADVVARAHARPSRGARSPRPG